MIRASIVRLAASKDVEEVTSTKIEVVVGEILLTSLREGKKKYDNYHIEIKCSFVICGHQERGTKTSANRESSSNGEFQDSRQIIDYDTVTGSLDDRYRDSKPVTQKY